MWKEQSNNVQEEIGSFIPISNSLVNISDADDDADQVNIGGDLVKDLKEAEAAANPVLTVLDWIGFKMAQSKLLIDEFGDDLRLTARILPILRMGLDATPS